MCIPHARFNTILILVVNFGLYLVTSIYSMRSGDGGAMEIDSRTLVELGAKYAPLIEMGQWWRLVTAGFLHGGLFHLLINSWLLYDLGTQVEGAYGASRMWVIYLVSGVFGFSVSAVWNPVAPSVGASPALCGLTGAMVVLWARHRSARGLALARAAVYGLLFLLCFTLATSVLGALGYYVSTGAGASSSAGGVWALVLWLTGAAIMVWASHSGALGPTMLSAILNLALVRVAIYGALFLLPWPGVDTAGHVGGTVAGLGVAYLADAAGNEGPVRERAWRAASRLCILVVAVSFLAMFLALSRAA
jgi:membrane associated rhomboid family serine protease